MNLFNDAWIPTDKGVVSFREVLFNKDVDYQLEVNSDEYEMMFFHLLACLGTVSIKPSSPDRIGKLLKKGVGEEAFDANIEPLREKFTTKTFMQASDFAFSCQKVLADDSKDGKKAAKALNKTRKSVQRLLAMPDIGATNKTHAAKIGALEHVCEQCSSAFVLNYHVFMMSMFSSKSVNGAAFSGTINIIIGESIRDTILLNCIPHTDAFDPSFNDKYFNSPHNIIFNALSVLEKIFLHTSQLFVPFENRDAVCECCGQEKKSFIESSGVLAETNKFTKLISIDRENISHPLMSTKETKDKKGVKIKPYTNPLKYIWTGLANYIEGAKIGDSTVISPSINVSNMKHFRYRKPTAIGVLAYDWNQADLALRLVETFNVGTNLDDEYANQLAQLVRYLLLVKYKMNSQLSMLKGCIGSGNYEKITGASEKKKDVGTSNGLANMLFMSRANAIIHEYVNSNISGSKEVQDKLQKEVRGLVKGIFDELLMPFENRGRALREISFCYARINDICKWK